MKRIIRKNTFETNSSSTHSLTIMTQEKWNEFRCTDKYLAGFDGELYEVDKLIEDHKKWLEKYPEDYEVKPETREDWIAYLTSYECADRYYTYSQWGEYEWSDYLESFAQRFETPSGDKMIAIGYYGNNY